MTTSAAAETPSDRGRGAWSGDLTDRWIESAPAAVPAGDTAATPAGDTAATPAGESATPAGDTEWAPSSRLDRTPSNPRDAAPGTTDDAEVGAGTTSTGAGATRTAGRGEPWRRRRPTLRALLVSLLVAALVAAVVVVGLRLRHADQLDRALAAARAAASSGAVALSAYSYHHLDGDFAGVEARSTPAFASRFRQSSSSLRKVLLQYKAASTGIVIATGVSSVSTGRAVVLVFVNQTVSNSTTKAPTTERSRLLMTMVERGGRWLIDNVTLE